MGFWGFLFLLTGARKKDKLMRLNCGHRELPRELPPRHLSQVKPGHRDQQPTGVYSSWVDEKRRLAEAIRLFFEMFFPKCSGFCLKSLGEDPVV